jgi:RimJ/RimL family protein N-acetyltransferase
VVAQPIEFRATGRRILAVGGWVYVPRDDRCDVSIAVADEWQGQTLGTLVVLTALGAAFMTGHRRFSAEVLVENARMLGLLRDLGAPMRMRHDAGVTRLEFELPEA